LEKKEGRRTICDNKKYRIPSIPQEQRHATLTKTGIEMKPLPEDWITRLSYKNAASEEIVPRYTYKPPTKTDPYVDRKVKTYYMCFTTGDQD
jgi:hypothetical protein